MIKQVPHTAPGTDPAGVALALQVAYELHAPVTRAPEVAVTAAAPARRAAAHRRRTVRG
ncbi:hypothetical protein [Streptomyces sp. S.PNR 29]|uniref:hypothetical protein n=1 Tax=Streptomyces sp. S.PNR 29 TaxID=2973805 RepID=UPI0025AF495A|nr:hypothetical protein [Streptomyces sp. S.PNR 29]MDN0194280.1 hypothetical protein [Streptomyces sp. S.PNR 29]